MNLEMIAQPYRYFKNEPGNRVNMIHLLIVAEQPALRKGLHMRLAAETDFTVVGEAAECETALAMAIAHCPDIALVDADMTVSDGIAVANMLHTICPKTSVIILSIHDDIRTCKRAEEAGAAAIVVKSLPADTLLTAIRGVVS
jgi:DNA-binding NarL/FixJ family response regulator